jgi:hypothetical protein
LFIEPNASFNRQNISDLPQTPKGGANQILAISLETHLENIVIDRVTEPFVFPLKKYFSADPEKNISLFLVKPEIASNRCGCVFIIAQNVRSRAPLGRAAEGRKPCGLP